MSMNAEPRDVGGVDGLTPLDAIDDAETRSVVARMRRVCVDADPVRWLPDVPAGRVPRHMGIIMDGNGRWAASRGLPRLFGHRNGAGAVRETLEWSGRLGIEVLTLFAFSSENWKRPRDEVSALMGMYLEYIAGERDELVSRNIRLRQIGRRDGLSEEALAALDATLEATRGCTGPTLCLAVNYGGRGELVDAARSIAERVSRGELGVDSIDEETVSMSLGTAGLVDPDVIVRTAGECRLSNFMLWQSSYAELVVREECWPDFGRESLFGVVREYAGRTRRFGGVPGAEGA